MDSSACSRRQFLAATTTALLSTTIARTQTTGLASPAPLAPRARRTILSIQGDQFFINAEPTYAGRTFRGQSVEGRLFNCRMALGICDNLNPDTVSEWAYPDTGRWDAERNVREFLAAMPAWRAHGLLAFTLNLQGGSPETSSPEQSVVNSAFEADGSLRPDYMSRLERILDFADELGMVVILGYFCFSQAQLLKDEAAIIKAIDHATQWLLERNYTHLLIEVANETSFRGYAQKLLQRGGIARAIRRVQQHTLTGRRLLAGTSYPAKILPSEDVIACSDFILLHGNGRNDADNIRKMVRRVRKSAAFKPKPILFNQDDHAGFDLPDNNLTAALGEGASWGFFDQGSRNYVDGYECPPINWQINTARKQTFFKFISSATGIKPAMGG